MASGRKRHTQVEITFRTWGGKRKRAGRRPAKGWRAGQSHDKRPVFAGTTAVHVTLRVVEAVGRLRRRDAYHAIRRTMAAMLGRDAFRIVHISLEQDHIHLIVEAESSEALARGMQGFQISAAKRLNAGIEKRGERRQGRVFADRYHAVIIRSPTQARNSIGYVLGNWLRHGLHVDVDMQFWNVDYYSSGPSFRGWKEMERGGRPFEVPAGYQPLPVAEPRGWMLAVGWKKAGAISLRDIPGPERGVR